MVPYSIGNVSHKPEGGRAAHGLPQEQRWKQIDRLRDGVGNGLGPVQRTQRKIAQMSWMFVCATLGQRHGPQRADAGSIFNCFREGEGPASGKEFRELRKTYHKPVIWAVPVGPTRRWHGGLPPNG